MTQRRAAEAVLQTLRKGGHIAYFAGGCVRDLLMQREPKDFDVATDATPAQVSAMFRNTQQVGAKFGVVIVRRGGCSIEVATFRTDGSYADGRRPDKVEFCDAKHDAERRDFTINGMFFDPVDAKIIDHVGGKQDIERRIVRAIGEPDRRFAEDHLRMLRAVRFAARFDFDIEAATADAIRSHAADLQHISAERIGAELEMILCHPTRRRGWELMADLGLADHLAAEVDWSRDESAHAAALLGRLGEPVSLPLALSALFVGREPSLAARMCRAIKCSNVVFDGVRWLLNQLPRATARTDFELADYKLLMADARFGDLLALMRAEIGESGVPTESLDDWSNRIRTIAPDAIAPPRLITGDDLLAMGMQPGQAMGALLDDLYRSQLNETLTTRDEAIEQAGSRINGPPPPPIAPDE